MLGRYRKHWSVTEHRAEVSPIGYQALTIVYIETVHSFLHSLLKFYTEQKFVWFCYLVVFITLYFFANSYLFYLVLLLKITLFNTIVGKRPRTFLPKLKL